MISFLHIRPTTLLLYVWYIRKPQNAMHYFLFGGQKGGESKLLFVIVNEWAGKGIPRGRSQYNLLRSSFTEKGHALITQTRQEESGSTLRKFYSVTIWPKIKLARCLLFFLFSHYLFKNVGNHKLKGRFWANPPNFVSCDGKQFLIYYFFSELATRNW